MSSGREIIESLDDAKNIDCLVIDLLAATRDCIASILNEVEMVAVALFDDGFPKGKRIQPNPDLFA